MRLIDGNKIVISLADWWYSSFGREETEESKAIKKVMDQVEKMVMEMPEIVRCKDCKWYDPPHIKYNDGTREDFPKEPFVTADIGSTIGGKCIAKNKIYCIAHDRENPDDYEEIVMFRSPDDYCSYGETKVTSKLKNPCDSLLKSDPDECKEKKSKLDTDLISRQAVIDLLLDAQDGSGQTYEVVRELLHEVAFMPPVEPKQSELHIDEPRGYTLKTDKAKAYSERPKGECRTCERCSDHCCETDEDLTRCPIEEHYSLPKDGYCHLYDPIWRGDKE